jgi:DNA-binding NarL/FixJ family response regulator
LRHASGAKDRMTRAVLKTQVMIVDDHPIVRQGLTQLINRERDMEVCAEAADSYAAMAAIEAHPPDFLIVDISLKTMDGLTLIKEVKHRRPRLPVLVVSMHEESLYAERALRAGAMGYIMKQEGTEKMIEAVRKILEGKIYLSDPMDERLLRQAVMGPQGATFSPVESLSDRELEVFDLLGNGSTSRQIAERLFISVKTVDTYRTHIKEKLGLQNAMELIQHAIHWVQRGRPS